MRNFGPGKGRPPGARDELSKTRGPSGSAAAGAIWTPCLPKTFPASATTKTLVTSGKPMDLLLMVQQILHGRARGCGFPMFQKQVIAEWLRAGGGSGALPLARTDGWQVSKERSRVGTQVTFAYTKIVVVSH